MKELIASLIEMGILASPDALYLLSQQERPLDLVREILAGRGELLYLEEEHVNEAIESHKLNEEYERTDGKGGPMDGAQERGGTSGGGGTGEGQGEPLFDVGQVKPLFDVDQREPLFEAGQVELIRNIPLIHQIADEDGETISLTKPLIPLRGVDRYRPMAAEYSEDIEISGDITGRSWCEGKISDFLLYFSDRLKRLRTLIRTKPEMMHALPIARARGKSGEVATIGMVTKVYQSEKGLSIEIEDEEESISLFISKSKNARLLRDIGTVLNDEVIGVIGNVRPASGDHGPSMYPSAIIRPPLPFRHSRNHAMEDVSVAFVSDLHVGSNTFLKNEWKRVVSFLKGNNPETREVASRIKYLVFTGDVVDGIGVYPGHDEDLDITDIFLQYEALAQDLNSIPDHIKVIISPGNHDGVRKAEPQPAFPKDIQKIFDRERVTFTGNPITIRLHGVNFLTYHGGSMDDIIPAVPGLTYENPIGAMKEMMIRRHLVPIYGGKTPIAPEHKDYLLIDEIPDVFVTGHVHTTGISNFHNILMINASTWMAQTAYQKMRDFVPDPAKLPVVRLDTLKPTLIHFGE